MGQMVENWNLKGNLSAKVAAAVFLSIVVIEAVILIPSYLNYERDLLFRLSGRTWTQCTPLKRSPHCNARCRECPGRAKSGYT